MTWSELRDHLVSAAAGAALLGGGATIISNKVDVSVLDTRVKNLEKLNGNIETLQSELAETRIELARIHTASPPKEP